MRILSLCISREFTILRAGRSSPVTDWLRALAQLETALAEDQVAVFLALGGGWGEATESTPFPETARR